MKPISYLAVTFIFAFFVCLVFQTLPVFGVNKVQANELRDMPTYDFDPDGEEYPKLGALDKDGYIFRTVEYKIYLIVDAEDVAPLLPGSGWRFPNITSVPTEIGEAIVEISWIYRIFSQWPDTLGYESSTNEAIGSVSIGVFALKPMDPPPPLLRYFILANVSSPGNAVELNNATVGGGAEVSRVGDLKMEFKSQSKSNGKSTLKFKAKLKEPISGLTVKVDANLPEGQEATRDFANLPNPPLRILFMDLSKTPPEEGRPFQWWSQKEEYLFDENTQDFELEVKIANNELKLPGNKILPVKEIGSSLLLHRNVEAYVRFDSE